MNACTWHHISGSMFQIDFQTRLKKIRIRLNFQISKLDLSFQINSNEFSKDRSFQHQTCLSINCPKKMKRGIHWEQQTFARRIGDFILYFAYVRYKKL